jgi:hypothetical protein
MNMKIKLILLTFHVSYAKENIHSMNLYHIMEFMKIIMIINYVQNAVCTLY